MRTTEQILKAPGISETELNQAKDLAVSLIREKLDEYTECFPDSNSQNQFYPKTENLEWTTGFWTGQIWLAYKITGEECFKIAGNIQVESFMQRILQRQDVDHHDMGFLFSPSCVAAWQLTGNQTARRAALLAADNLMERFQEKGQFFQAWGTIGAADNYRLIIDCLLNMPLLFWASAETGLAVYREKAIAHITTAMKLLIRPDCSTYHTYFFDPVTGEPVRGVTHQGNRDGSAWSRGQAWGVYGTAMAYRYVRNKEYIEIFEKVTKFFLEHLPENLIPYWDFDFDDGSTEPRDSSAAAIAVCGMLQMARYLSKEKADFYRQMASRLMYALWQHCAVRDSKSSGGLLRHGTYARGSVNNPCTDRGVDECNLWGDYYYLEGLVKCIMSMIK